MWKKIDVKLGSGHAFLVLGAHVKVLTPINGLPLQCNSTETSMMSILVEVKT
jgi:hypothetical protein